MNVRICPVSWSFYQQALSELGHTRSTDTCPKQTTAYVLTSTYSPWANNSMFSFLLIFKFHLQSQPNRLHMDFRSSPVVLTKVAILPLFSKVVCGVHQLFLSIWPNIWLQDGPVHPFSVPSSWNSKQRPQLCCLPSVTFHQAVKLRSRRLQSAPDIFSLSLHCPASLCPFYRTTNQGGQLHSLGLLTRQTCDLSPCIDLERALWSSVWKTTARDWRDS